MNELVARIRVALRHTLKQQGEKPILHAGDLTLDQVKPSPKEYDIAHDGAVTLERYARTIACPDQVWGSSACGSAHYITTETGVDARLREVDQLGYRSRP